MICAWVSCGAYEGIWNPPGVAWKGVPDEALRLASSVAVDAFACCCMYADIKAAFGSWLLLGGLPAPGCVSPAMNALGSAPPPYGVPAVGWANAARNAAGSAPDVYELSNVGAAKELGSTKPLASVFVTSGCIIAAKIALVSGLVPALTDCPNIARSGFASVVPSRGLPAAGWFRAANSEPMLSRAPPEV